MTVPDRVGIWRTSTYSGQGQDCVEVRLGVEVDVRDTKARKLGKLTVPAGSWRALLAAVRD
jgi:hypothetical protein